MSNTKLITWNVKGINNVVKRRKVLSSLKKEGAHIALIQETHLSDLEHVKLRRDWVGQVFYSSFNSKSRGVAILLHKRLPFTLEKCIKDNEGRYVIISGFLYGERLILGCIYSPNTFEASFYSKLLADLSSDASPLVVLGGDMNACLEPELDQRPVKSTCPSRMGKAIKALCCDLNLYDTWRILNPKTRDYTFFSRPHNSLSRIDYFFASRQALDRIRTCTIKAMAISDHSLVDLELTPPYFDPAARHWRLNPSLLSNPTFVSMLEEQLMLFFSTNDTSEVSASTLWETAKAYIRGVIISYSSAKRKETLRQQLHLESQVSALEREFKHSLSKSSRLKLDAARSALDNFLTQKAETAIFYARHRLYESANKPGRLLARLARGRVESNVIASLKDDKGVTFFENKHLVNIMKCFYQNLYSPESLNDTGEQANFLGRIDLPTLSEESRDRLCRPVTKEEVFETIKSLLGGKAPGPDGFCPEFYKKMARLVVEPLTRMYTESFEHGELPPTLNLANISLILKKGKPSDCCSSYRPISLIGVDCKLLSKLLARRLEALLPALIKPDQTGFIRNRFSHSNVRRLLNVIQHANCSQERILCVALDAAKAFDRVEFEYLFEVLQKFGLGPEFIRWIRLLYSAPMARVLVNGIASEAFRLGRGTRQGCPLSPLLFALAIEPLAEAIRCADNILGVNLCGTVHKLALYADDVILFLTQPESSVPALISTIELFGKFSGYKINFDKSEALPLGDFGDKSALPNFPFKWSDSGFTYLGVKISANLNNMCKLNLSPVLSSIKSDLIRWFDLPLSWLGRVSLIKMNVLPRILYPMQMLPLRINNSVFSDIDKAISRFIWHGKKPRLSLKTLRLTRENGGLSLPDFKLYNWTCHMRIVHGWLKHFMDPTQETQIDAWHCPLLSPLSLAVNKKSLLPVKVKNSPIMMNTIRTWERLVKPTQSKDPTPALHPIIQNKAFPPGLDTNIFQCWYNLGIKIVRDLFEGDRLLSFDQIRTKFGVPSQHFYGYLQVRHFIDSLGLTKTQPVTSPVDSFLLQCQHNKKIASFFLQETTVPHSM